MMLNAKRGETMRHRLNLLLALLLLFSISAARGDAPASPFGINIHAPQGADLAAQLDRARAAGIGWVRIDLIWAAVEPARGKYEWRAYDALVKAANVRGLKVFATLAYTPAWATDGPALTGVPRNPDDWRRICFRAAKRYRGKVQHWGLWNEPNLPRFWSGSRQQYIDVILKIGADALRTGNPEALVGGPDLAHLTAGDADWYDWLRRTLLEAGDSLDFITHHVYDADGNRDVTTRLDAKTLFGTKPSLWDAVAPSVKEVLRSTGWLGRKPVWLTETGWESARISERRQADFYGGLLDDWFGGRPGRDWIERVFFYELQDGPSAGGLSWGILRSDGNPKPAYDAYRTFIKDH
jgi:hypothetical protein